MTETPIDDGAYTAVLDRFEGNLAVLLVEDGDSVVGDAVVARERLPESGRHQDAVFDVVFEDGDPVDFDYRPETTEERREGAQSRFDRLSRRAPPAVDGEDGIADSDDGDSDDATDAN